jgi:sugar/nucleoside kinase (ribokinase family)
MSCGIFGLIVADLIAEPMDLRHPPAPGGLVVAKSITLTTGGNVCNTSIALAKLGTPVLAAGMVGNDILGRAVIDRMQQFGVDTSCVQISDQAQTSSTVVAVEPGGERCFFHVPGVCTKIDAAVFRKCMPALAKCEYVQIGYFGLLPALTPVLPELLAEFRRLTPNTKVAVETVNPPGTWEELRPILPHLDLFCPSRTEAIALINESDPVKIVKTFRKYIPRAIIGVKLDAEGCYLDDGVTSMTIPAYPIKVIDTTGAGDTWFGGLLTGLSKKMSLKQAGQLANRTAADCCTALGASSGLRSFEETIARI